MHWLAPATTYRQQKFDILVTSPSISLILGAYRGLTILWCQDLFEICVSRLLLSHSFGEILGKNRRMMANYSVTPNPTTFSLRLKDLPSPSMARILSFVNPQPLVSCSLHNIVCRHLQCIFHTGTTNLFLTPVFSFIRTTIFVLVWKNQWT